MTDLHSPLLSVWIFGRRTRPSFSIHDIIYSGVAHIANECSSTLSSELEKGFSTENTVIDRNDTNSM